MTRSHVTALLFALMTWCTIAGFAPAQESDKEKKPQETPKKEASEKADQEDVKPWLLKPVEGMTTTRSGLRYKVLQEGRGEERPGLGATCFAKWKAWTPDEKVFDTWETLKKPAEVRVGWGMPGWNEVLQLMRPGSKFLVHLPWDLAYGERGRQHIPGKTEIGVEIELLRFKPGPDLPPFQDLDEKFQTRLPSGVCYQVVEPGTGEVARDHIDQCVVHWDAYTTRGELFQSSVLGRTLIKTGTPSKLGGTIGGDLAHLLKEGAVILARVPGGLFGNRRMNALGPGEESIWRFRVGRVVRREPPEAAPILLKSGIKCWVVKEGSGPRVTRTSNVATREATWIKNGGCIHSSFNLGGTISYGLRRLWKAKRKALISMKVGSRCYFELPYEMVKDAPGMSRLAKGTNIILYVELRRSR